MKTKPQTGRAGPAGSEQPLCQFEISLSGPGHNIYATVFMRQSIWLPVCEIQPPVASQNKHHTSSLNGRRLPIPTLTERFTTSECRALINPQWK